MVGAGQRPPIRFAGFGAARGGYVAEVRGFLGVGSLNLALKLERAKVEGLRLGAMAVVLGGEIGPDSPNRPCPLRG